MKTRFVPDILVTVLILATVPAIAAEPPAPWFDRLVDVEPLAPALERELARHLADRFLEPASSARLPRVLKSDRAPRMVFVSVSDGHGPARVLRGAGEGSGEAIRRLLDSLQESLDARWVKVDLVRAVVREDGLDPGRPLNLPRSLHGLAFDRSMDLAFLPEELVAQTLVDSDQLLRLEKIAGRLESPVAAAPFAEALKSRSLTVYRFATTSFLIGGDSVPPEGGRRNLVPLYRGHRGFEAPTPELLLAAARSGGEYLRRAVRGDGRFVYSYRPKTGGERDRYNLLRHAGTIYSMLELYEVTGEEALLAAAERAIAYLERAIEPCTDGDQGIEAACAVEKDFVKLGGNALAIIALAKHAEVTGSGDRRELIEGLGRWILATQSDAGEFTVHKVHQRTGKLDDHVSQYYPGEAVLALLRGGPVVGEAAAKQWLEAAAKGARWLIEVRDRALPDHKLNHDHWLLYGLNELHRRQPDPLYLEHARRTTAAILRLQNRRPSFADWRGSYYNPPRSTPTATRSEGLAAAYLLERDHGAPDQAADLLEGLELGVRFQLQTQFRPESALYLPDPRRALGGFRRSLTHYEVRIDYVQHNVSALLLLRRILLEQR